MLGAIAGDIIGSVYEWHNIKTKEFPLFVEKSTFTDDSVLTIALAETLLSGTDYGHNLKVFTRRYPKRGYGGHFLRWVQQDETEPYQSYGNGAPMRISPVGWAAQSLEQTLEWAERYTAVTHNHPEGIKGGQAVAVAIYLARTGASREAIQQAIESRFGYDLSVPLEAIRPHYTFDVSSQGSVPPAIRAFLESTDFEDAIRNAISIGGDSDTLACITGSIAEAFYGGVPEAITQEVYARLDAPLGDLVRAFYAEMIR